MATADGIEYRVLGPLEVVRNGALVALESAKQRALLAALLVNFNEVVSTERLLDGVWHGSPPDAGVKTLRFHVSKLRDALDPDRTGSPLATKPPGYLLEVEPDDIDAVRFEAAVAEARGLAQSDPAACVDLLRDSLASWRGRAYAEFQYDEFAHATAVRLDQLRLTAVEDRIDAELALGRHFELIPELESLVVEHPLRERLTEMWMLALYRSGRQADALRAFQRLRTRLIDELGADPGPAIVALEQRILEQDPALESRVESRALGVTRAVRGYELRGLVGRDRLGEQHRAYQPAAGREVAIKVIGPELADQSEFIQRFELEAAQVAALEHEHIAPIYDYWREPGAAYLVTRWLRGGDLESALQRRAWTVDEALELLTTIGGALSYAHRLGVVHLDLKPSNVLLDDDGTAVLGGFGAARLFSAPVTADPAERPLTPAYAAPEQLTRGLVGPLTDVYQLALLAFEIVTGSHPFTAETPERTVERRLEEDLPAASGLVGTLPGSVDAVLRRAAARDPAERYSTVDAFLEALHDALGTAATPATLRRRNPYKGLAAFRTSDAADFFGRQVLVERLVARYAESGEGSRFLALVGPSGSGKSSVAYAGVIPALRAGAVAGSDRWLFAAIQPGVDPFYELGSALQSVTTAASGDLVARLSKDELGVHEVVRRSLPGEGWELFLLIDQFEELFTMTPAADRARFLTALLTAVTHPRSQLRVMATLRADYYDRPLLHNQLGELMRMRTETVLPLTPAELEEAITRPALRSGVALEPGLVGAILGDVSGQPGVLPLVQYAMTELFEASEDVMTVADYREIGGVGGAVAQRADSTIGLLSAAGRQAAPRVLLELVELGEGAEDTRRRVPLATLENLDPAGGVAEVLERFGEARLLAFDRDPATRVATVEVVHEALLKEWPTLRRWIEDGRDRLRAERRVGEYAAEWDASGRDTALLLQGSRLALADDLADARLEPYVDASRQARLRGRRRRRLAFIGLTVVAGLLAIAAVIAIAGQRRAQSATVAALADTARNLSDSDPALALALALEADAMGRTPQTRGAVLAALDAFSGKRGLHLATLSGFSGPVWSLAYQEDGTQLIGANDWLLGVQPWDVVSLEPSEPFEEWHERSLREIALTSDGRVVTASLDNTITARALTRGSEPMVFAGHEHQVWAVDVHEGAGLLASGARDGTARIWELDTGQQRILLDPKASARQSASRPETHMAVWSVRFSPDGARLATVGEDGMVRIWDVATGLELAAAQAHAESGQDLAFTPDGSTLLSAGNEGLVVAVDPVTAEPLGRVYSHGSRLRAIAVSRDGSLMATGAVDGSVAMWDLASGEQLAVMRGHEGIVHDVSFDPSGGTVASAGGDGSIRLWDTGRSRGVIIIDGHHDDTGPGRQKRIHSLAYHPDGSRIVTGSADGTARLWNSVDGTAAEVLTIVEDDQVWEVAISPDGSRVAAGVESGQVLVWDTTSGAQLGSLTTPEHLRGFEFTADGRHLIVGSREDITTVVDVDALTTAFTIPAHSEQTRQLAVAPDGRIVQAGSDGIAKVWSADGSFLADVPADGVEGHDGALRMVVFSPDGALMATSAGDGKIILWDGATYEKLEVLAGHVAGIRALAISPDSAFLVSGSEDSTVRIWDLESRSHLATWRRQTADIWSAAVSPDGDWIASSSADGTVAVGYAGTETELMCRWLEPYVFRSELVAALGDATPQVCTELP